MDLQSPAFPRLGDQLSLIQEIAPFGLAIVGIDGHWQDVNPALCRLVGREREELLKLTFQEITHPDDLAADLAELNRMLAGEIGGFRSEKRYFHADGHEVWVQLDVTLVSDPTGAPLHFIAQIQNITERRDAVEMLDVIFEASADLLCVIDVNGSFLKVNPSWTRLLGWTPEELTSRPYVEFLHPDDLEATLAAWEAALDAGLRTTNFENRYRAKDGTFHWLQWNSYTMADKGWVICNARDVTEQKRRALELQQSHADLANFAAVITHDIKSPLGTITGFGQLTRAMLHQKGEHGADAYLDAIQRGAQRMADLVDGVLEYSKAGVATKLTNAEAETSAIVANVLDDLAVAIADTAADIRVASLPRVNGDPHQLRQVFQNLVANSLKFGRDGVPITIEITAQRADAEWRFAVRDNGTGMTEQDSASAFDVFRQGADGRPRGGVGLGLATCKRLVERHGGRIWMDSRAGVGTTVSFSIPEAQ